MSGATFTVWSIHLSRSPSDFVFLYHVLKHRLSIHHNVTSFLICDMVLNVG